MELVKVKS